MARVGEEFLLERPRCGGDIRLGGEGRQESAHFKRGVCKRKKARMAKRGKRRVSGGLSPKRTSGDAARATPAHPRKSPGYTDEHRGA
jgi:hypothetical protein